MALYLSRTPLVRRDVDRWKVPNICFFIALLLAHFGSRFDFGLVFQVLIITVFLLTLSSLLITWVA